MYIRYFYIYITNERDSEQRALKEISREGSGIKGIYTPSQDIKKLILFSQHNFIVYIHTLRIFND